MRDPSVAALPQDGNFFLFILSEAAAKRRVFRFRPQDYTSPLICHAERSEASHTELPGHLVFTMPNSRQSPMRSVGYLTAALPQEDTFSVTLIKTIRRILKTAIYFL